MRALIVLVLLVAACGASGHSKHSASAPVSPPSVAPLPSSAVPVTAGVSGCPPHAVTAADAPFCYPLPKGFTDFSARDDYAYGWQWRTLVAIGPHDLIQVLGEPVQTDIDKLSDAQTLVFARQLSLRVGALGVLQTGPVTTSSVDNARAFVQDATYAHGIRAHNYVVMRGHDVIVISCQSTPGRAATVYDACTQLVAAIVIG